jgi:transglycosylase-like protein
MRSFGIRRRPVPRQLAPQPRRSLAAVPVLLLSLGLIVGAMTAMSASAQASTRHHHHWVVRYGDDNSKVAFVQRALGVHPVSGWFGPITRAHVNAYKLARGRHANGKVGHKMWRELHGTSSHHSSSRSSRPSRSSTRSSRLNWHALAMCESSNNPRAVSPAGYYGLYQFSPSTWRSVGGHGLPSHASRSEQLKRAEILYRRSGSSPWPVCGRRLYS